MTDLRPVIRVIDLGTTPYGATLDLQRRLCRERIDGRQPDDLLLLLEHPTVVTLGRNTKAASLPIPPDQLRARGLEVFEVERGGDVTLHAPGQLVGYPIFHLEGHRPDLHWYLRQVEAALIAALLPFGIPAERSAGQTGVWTRGRKIASIGIHVKQWVTFHGFALNVTTALDLFDLIVPCGLHGVSMTSVRQEATTAAEEDLDRRVRVEVAESFGRAFERPIVWTDARQIAGEPPVSQRR